MIRLIQTELTKIFHKKSIYIIWLMIFLFCLLNNILYKKDYTEDGFYKYNKGVPIEKQIQEQKEELKKYNIDRESDKTIYLTIKTNLELLELQKSYAPTTWQYQHINEYLYDTAYQKNYYTDIEVNAVLKKEYEELYQTKLEALTKDNWKYFIEEELKEVNLEKEKIDKSLENTIDTLSRKNLLKEKEELNEKKEELEYRLKNKVKKEDNYLNQALIKYKESKNIINELKEKKKLTYEEKILYQNKYEELKENEYILKNKRNINKENSLNTCLKNITEDYEIFLIIIIILISSTIINDEFNKGTIKLLLIKPYSRGKIIISKFITCLIILCLSITLLVINQLILGSIFLGTSSLKLPVIAYSWLKKEIVEYPIWIYTSYRILARLPFFIMVILICFTISVLITNASLTITLSILVYFISTIMQSFYIKYKLKWLLYTIPMNWHFENLLFGKLPEIKELTSKFSNSIWVIHFIILSLITYIEFKKKNIKNI